MWVPHAATTARIIALTGTYDCVCVCVCARACVCVFDCTVYRATVKVSARMSHSTAALISFSLHGRKSKSTSLQADVGEEQNNTPCLALLRILTAVIALALHQLLIHHTASLVVSIGNAWCYFRHEWIDTQSLFFLHSVTLPQMWSVPMDCNRNLNLIRCFSQAVVQRAEARIHPLLRVSWVDFRMWYTLRFIFFMLGAF